MKIASDLVKVSGANYSQSASVLIKNGSTAAQIQTALRAGGANLSVVFEGGEYNLEAGVYVYDLTSLTINFNGATFISNNSGGNLLNFSTQPEVRDMFFRIAGALPTWFLSNIERDSYYVEVADPANFGTMTKGDMFIVSDSRVSESLRYTMGLVLFFDHFENVEGIDRMYFSKPAQHSVLCKDDLLYDSGFGGGYYVCKIPMKGVCNISNFHVNNVGLYIEGFNITNISDCSSRQTVFDFQSADQISCALNIPYSRFINVNNYTAWGNNRAGYGYGITSLAWDIMNVNNMVGWYCRHCITSSTTYAHYSNQINLSNSYFAGAYDQFSNPENGTACIDTHVGVWDININHCTVEGAQIGVHLRGNGATVSNSTFNNCNYVITTDGDEPEGVRKRRIVMNDCNVRGLNLGFFKADIDVYIEDIVIDRVHCDMSKAPSGFAMAGIYTAGVTAHVENLTISNSYFKGRLGVAGETNNLCTFLSIANDVTTKGIANIVLKNNHIVQFDRVLNSQLPLQDSTLIEGNTIEKFGTFYRVDTVDNIDAIGFVDCLIKDNNFKLGKAIFDFSFDTFKITDLRFYGNNLELIGDLLIQASGSYFGEVRLIGNNFKDSLYGLGYIFALANCPINYLLEKDNTYHKSDSAKIDAAIAAWGAYGYTNATSKGTSMGMAITKFESYPTVYESIGNTYMGIGWNDEYVQLTGVKYKCLNNKFVIAALNNTKLFDLSTCDAEIMSNDIIIDSLSGTTEIIEFNGAGGILKLVGNNIINNSVANVVRLYDLDDISYLDLGNNTYRMNTASTIDNCTILTP